MALPDEGVAAFKRRLKSPEAQAGAERDGGKADITEALTDKKSVDDGVNAREGEGQHRRDDICKKFLSSAAHCPSPFQKRC